MSIEILKKDISNYGPTENTNIKKRYAKARKQQIVPKPKTKMTFLGNTKEEDLQLTEGRNNSFNTHRGGLNVGPVQEML